MALNITLLRIIGGNDAARKKLKPSFWRLLSNAPTLNDWLFLSFLMSLQVAGTSFLAQVRRVVTADPDNQVFSFYMSSRDFHFTFHLTCYPVSLLASILPQVSSAPFLMGY